jgi:hypothetical protein
MVQSQKFRHFNLVKDGALFALTLLATTCALMFMTPPVAAEPWKKVANWVLVGSPKLGGCTMATKFAGGAFLSITTVAASGGEQTFELLVSDDAWGDIRDGTEYTVDVLLVGSEQGPHRRVMNGFSNFSSNYMVSNALFVEFSASSEFSSFFSRGMETSSHIALYLGGRMLGIYALENANTAYEELLKCYQSNSSMRA